MLLRLGNVLGWTANIFALLIWGIGLAIVIATHNSGAPDGYLAGAASFGAGVLIFAIGRAARYVLAGTP